MYASKTHEKRKRKKNILSSKEADEAQSHSLTENVVEESTWTGKKKSEQSRKNIEKLSSHATHNTKQVTRNFSTNYLIKFLLHDLHIIFKYNSSVYRGQRYIRFVFRDIIW